MRASTTFSREAKHFCTRNIMQHPNVVVSFTVFQHTLNSEDYNFHSFVEICSMK